MITAAPPRDPGPRPWWEGRAVLIALILLSALPLLLPPVPPLVDLMGHMGRYRVQTDLSTSPWLHLYYDFGWAAIGNLGVDVLLVPLAPLLGLENAVKAVVLIIPPLTVIGFLWVAHEVHNRIPPTAFFALPFALGHPVLFGFVNFALSMALALLAFGLWLRLGRLGRTRLRAALFVPISLLVFFTHTFGWGMLGLLAFSADAVRQHDRGSSWWKSGPLAALHAAVLLLPLLIMVAWRSETHGGMTHGWFDWGLKLEWIMAALRDRWQAFDLASIALIGLIFAFALLSPKLVVSRNLGFSALVLLIAFLLLPWTVFGSAYADMRIVPYAMAITLLGIRFRAATDRRLAIVLAVAGLAFYLVRLAGTAISLNIASADQQRLLTALDHVPMGARVISLVETDCRGAWALPRNSHLGAMVIVRRHGFSNDQWVIEGANLLKLRYGGAERFSADPSQIVRPPHCNSPWTAERAMSFLGRAEYDYLWLVDVGEAVAPPPGHVEVWRSEGSLLYRAHGG